MYQPLARVEDIPEGKGKVVQVGQRQILLLNQIWVAIGSI